MSINELIDKKIWINYKKLTEIFGLPYCDGGQKTNQIDTLGQQYVIERRKSKFLVVREKTPQEIEDELFERRDGFMIYEEDQNRSGVYKIQYENKIYIGETINLRNRFRSHMCNYGNMCSKTQELLLLGGSFSVICFTDNLTTEQRKAKELEYIKKYCEDGLLECININLVKRKYTKKQTKTTIKVPAQQYDSAIEILKKGGIKIL